MTKTISLADDAYEALARVKGPQESFSDLARRLARRAALDLLLEGPAEPPILSDAEAEAEKARIYRERDATKTPRYP